MTPSFVFVDDNAVNAADNGADNYGYSDQGAGDGDNSRRLAVNGAGSVYGIDHIDEGDTGVDEAVEDGNGGAADEDGNGGDADEDGNGEGDVQGDEGAFLRIRYDFFQDQSPLQIISNIYDFVKVGGEGELEYDGKLKV